MKKTKDIAMDVPTAIGKHLMEAEGETPLTNLIRRVQNEGISKHTFLQYVCYRWVKVKDGGI